MAYTKAGMKATDKYVKENYDKIIAKVPKGRKATIKALAESKGESVNGYINALIRADMGLSEDEWRKKEEE